MNREKIGEVVITYTPDGKPSRTEFLPSIRINSEEVVKQLITIQSGGIETVKSNSDLVMSAWFSKINDIELMNPSDKRINSEVIDCLKREDGMVYYCRIAYFIEDVNHKL